MTRKRARRITSVMLIAMLWGSLGVLLRWPG